MGERKLDTPEYKPTVGSRFRSIFFWIVFATYALFVAVCAYMVFIDMPGKPSGGNIGAGWLGFLAAGAAGFPWSLLIFPLLSGCELLRITKACEPIFGDNGFVVICAVGTLLNFWLLGAIAKWWSFPFKR